MADLSITAANVKWSSGVSPALVKGGATITRGQALYRDSADNEHKLADANGSGTKTFAGIALTDGTDGSDMLIAPAGATINVGATTTAGVIYCVSATAGGIAPFGDLTAGATVIPVFLGNGTAVVTILSAYDVLAVVQ